MSNNNNSTGGKPSLLGSSAGLMDEYPLMVYPSLAVAVGVNRALFLQQLHYWLQKPGAHVRDGRKWIYNTYEGWTEQFPFWSSEVIRKRIVAPLEADGIILTTSDYNKNRSDKTKWYTIDYDVLTATLNPPDDLPEGTLQTLNPPDKTTSGTGQNAHTRTGQNAHMVNQRLPETNNRDSVLQTGDGENAAPTNVVEMPKPKPVKMSRFAITELMDRVNAKQASGGPIHKPLEQDKRQYGRFFETRSKDHDVDTLLLTLDYMVAKANGDIDGEPKAWCGFDTALDQVLSGWRPVGVESEEDREEAIQKAQENEAELQDLFNLISEGAGGE